MVSIQIRGCFCRTNIIIIIIITAVSLLCYGFIHVNAVSSPVPSQGAGVLLPGRQRLQGLHAPGGPGQPRRVREPRADRPGPGEGAVQGGHADVQGVHQEQIHVSRARSPSATQRTHPERHRDRNCGIATRQLREDEDGAT